jgi:hypothetical protein
MTGVKGKVVHNFKLENKWNLMFFKWAFWTSFWMAFYKQRVDLLLICSMSTILCTGKSFLEALIVASTNSQYDKRLFMELPWKLQAQNMGRTWVEHVLPMFCACSFHGNSMNNLLSYCGLIDAKIRASDKDLPVYNKVL